MRFHGLRACAAVASVGGLMAASSGLAEAQQPSAVVAFKKATFQSQDVAIKRLTANVSMTKDEQAPARAFTGPTSMIADPSNPRVMAAATANLRSKVCHVTVSKDGGQTWHFTKALPNPDAYPYCTTNSAGVPQSMIAWGRDGTLYSAHNAYGEGEGQATGQGHVSIVLARSTDLGEHWSLTLVDNNRGKTDVPPSDDGVTGLAVDTSGSRDVVHVGFNQGFPDAPTGSPLRNPIVMVATSTDGGATFPPPVNLNTFPLPTQTIAGKSYNLYLRSSFGSPFLITHGGTPPRRGRSRHRSDGAADAPARGGCGPHARQLVLLPDAPVDRPLHRPGEDVDDQDHGPPDLRR